MKSRLLWKNLAKFFKVVLPSDIEDQKLNIPVKSATEFEDELSDVATLTVPNGDVWQVGLERSHSQIWFVHGWHRFMKHYSITHGMFLVFGYQGNSTFHVCIFDFSCCEIEYPPTRIRNVEDVENDAGRTTRRASSSVKGKEKCVDQYVKRENDAKKMPCATKIPTKSNKDFKNFFLRKIYAYTSPSRKCQSDCQKLIHATTMFKLENPFFAVILTGLNFKACHMRVPDAFAKKYMRGCSSNSINSIRIEDSKGKWWNLGYYKHGLVFRIGRGCTGFFKDNYLKEGDVCLFELMKMRDAVLKVSVLHNAEYAATVQWKKKKRAVSQAYEDLNNNRCTQEVKEEPDCVDLTSTGDEEHANNAEVVHNRDLYYSRKMNGLELSRETKRALRKAKALNLENPAFMVILRFCNMWYKYVLVPADFVRDHMLKGDYLIKLEVENENEASSSSSSRKKQWSVLCVDWKPNCLTKQMKNGWKEFSEDNDLKAGDVCVYELIKKTRDVVFKVSIFRASDYAE